MSDIKYFHVAKPQIWNPFLIALYPRDVLHRPTFIILQLTVFNALNTTDGDLTIPLQK